MNISKGVSRVARYVDTVSYRLQERGLRSTLGRAPFVTISRQPGAGGHALSDAVIAELAGRPGDLFAGWEAFDHRLLTLLADNAKLKVSLRAILGEEYHSRTHDYFNQLLTGATPQDVVFQNVSHALRSVAAAGRVVIVGRAGVFVTGDYSGGIHIRLIGSEQTCVKNLSAQLGIGLAEARAKKRSLEESRARFVREKFGADVADPSFYDAVWNVDRVGIKNIARWIVDRIEETAGAAQAPSQRAASRAK